MEINTRETIFETSTPDFDRLAVNAGDGASVSFVSTEMGFDEAVVTYVLMSEREALRLAHSIIANVAHRVVDA